MLLRQPMSAALALAATTPAQTSCPTMSYDINKRTEFGTNGVDVYGWPSTGGVLIKEAADIVDLQFLNVDRLHTSAKSQDPKEEDLFCAKLQKIGAKKWKSEQDHLDVLLGEREPTAEQAQELVVGWSSSGGVYVLRYETQRDLPRNFGRLHMALTMEERVEVMREYGALFLETEAEFERFCRGEGSVAGRGQAPIEL